MVRAIFACSALGVPVLMYGNFEDAQWSQFSKVVATLGRMQRMDIFTMEAFGWAFTVKPTLTSFHKLYCIAVSDKYCESDSLVVHAVALAVDYLLHEPIAAVLAKLEQVAESEEANSTFANRADSDTGKLEECMNALFTTQKERDEFILFEQHYMGRLVSNGSDVVLDWLHSIRSCRHATGVYLFDFTAEGADITDFIAASEGCKVTISQVYAERIKHTPTTEPLRVATASAALKELAVRYLESYVALSAVGRAHDPEEELRTARVVNLTDTSAVWMGVISSKVLLVAETSVGALPPGATGARCVVHAEQAEPVEMRKAFARCCARLWLVYPERDAEHPPSVTVPTITAMLGPNVVSQV